MGFKSNQSEANMSDIKPEGTYECIIVKVERRTTKNGAKGLNFALVIRNDIESQQYKNAFLFHTIWHKKEPNELDKQVEGYNFSQLMAVGKAAKLPDGKDYENLDEYLKDLMLKCVRVTLKHEEYNGKKQERISYFNATDYPECKHKFKKTVTENTYANQSQTSFAKPDESVNSAIGSLADFEEVLSDDALPY